MVKIDSDYLLLLGGTFVLNLRLEVGETEMEFGSFEPS